MPSLEDVSKFLEKSGMRKVSTGLVMYAGIYHLRIMAQLSDAEFGKCFFYLVVALFGGNALEHYVKNKYRSDSDAQPK